MSEPPSGSMVFDTSVLIEIVRGSKAGLALKQALEAGSLSAHATEMNLFELRYLTCRREGWDKSSEVDRNLRDSAYFRVHDAHQFLEAAARLKCERSMSLVDCVTIAAGEALAMPVLFAKHEGELDVEIKRKPFKTEVRFLEDMQKDPE
jgi:uncharacterized protein